MDIEVFADRIEDEATYTWDDVDNAPDAPKEVEDDGTPF